jgi:peptidoglycan hydrolase CwlO-like protein
MQDQINDLKVAMANQQTIEAERWNQVTSLLKEMKDDLQKQREEITSLKIQLAQGSGAIKLILIAGGLVTLLLGLSRLLPVQGG